MTTTSWLTAVKFDDAGLVPVVAQEGRSGAVLMLAWADAEALERTAATGLAHYHSRSRGRLWQKGETSGNVQRVTDVRVDCDGDTVLYQVEQTGPACHTGAPTCFAAPEPSSRRPAEPASPSRGAAESHPLDRLAATVRSRAAERPAGSYTTRLLDAGVPKVAQKVGEEAVEVVVAATSEDDARLASEAADLIYHLLVLLEARGVPLADVWTELEHRSR